MGMLGWIVGGMIIGAALSGGSDGCTKDSRRGKRGTICAASYRNSKRKLVYKCPRCGHTWSK